MPFTFLHTGDWHIAKPFGRYPAELSGVLRHARLTAIDRLADAARHAGASHALIAGDLYDRPNLPDRDILAPLGQMSAHGDIRWHVIPGNHDPAVPGGVWERAVRLGLPGNVVLHLEARPVELVEGCWMLPTPLTSRAMSRDPTAWMDEAATPHGALRIGLAHGSVRGFGSQQAASIEIAPDRPRRAGLSYLALGDWHGALQIGPRVAYAGTPEPDGFLDNDPGHALIVTIDGADALPRITRRQVGEHRWLERRIETVRFSDLAALEGEIEGLGAAARKVILAVEVAGRATVAEERSIRRRIDRLEARVFHLERRLERLAACADVDDIAQLPEGALRDVGGELSRLAAEADHPRQAAAARALRHLFELSDTLSDTPGGAANGGTP